MKTLHVGDYPINKKIDPNSSAALMKVISTIYNLEEAITNPETAGSTGQDNHRFLMK
jgi:hypothetical protein